MNKKYFLIISSILTIFFLTAQTCSFGTTGLAADCVGEGDILCDDDSEAWECGLAAYGTGYYVSRASDYDVSECGAEEEEDETDLSAYEDSLDEIQNNVDDISSSLTDLQSDYDGASDARAYIIIIRSVLSLLDDIATEEEALADLSADLASVEGSDDLLTAISELEATLATLEADAETLKSDAESAVSSARTACTADSDCSGYRCSSRGYCVFSCTTDTQCDSANGYGCDAGTCTVAVEEEEEVEDITDSDGDGMPDEFEDAYGFDKNDDSDADEDADEDGVTNLEEYQAGTNPLDEESTWYTTDSSLSAHCGGTYEGEAGDTITLDASASTGTVTQYCIQLYPQASWESSFGPSDPVDYETTACTEITDVSEISYDYTFTYSGNYLLTLIVYGSPVSEYSFCSTNVDITCSDTSSDCYYDSYCESGVCVECNADSDCDAGYVCNTEYSCELDDAADADGDGVATGIEELLGFDPEDDNDLDDYKVINLKISDSHINYASDGTTVLSIDGTDSWGIIDTVGVTTDSEKGIVLDFSSAGYYGNVEVSSNLEDFDFSEWFIMTVIVKPSSTDDSSMRGIVSQVESSGNDRNYILKTYSGKYYAGVQTSDSGGLYDNAVGGLVEEGQWQEVTVVYSKSLEKLYLYVDGELKTTETGVSGDLLTSGEDLLIGGRSGGTPYAFQGQIDTIRVWGE